MESVKSLIFIKDRSCSAQYILQRRRTFRNSEAYASKLSRPNSTFCYPLLATIEKFIACPIRGDMECGLSDCKGLRSYRLHSLIMRTRCLTRSKRSHVPVCSAPAPRLTRSNRNIPVRGRYGKFGIALLDSGRRFWIVDRGTEQWRKQEGTGIPAEQFLHHCANWAGKQIIDGGGGGGVVVD